MKAYVYKAIDKTECEKLIAAWVSSAQTLHQHLRHNPLYKPFIKAMLKVITGSMPEEITSVLKPGFYETLLIPTSLREELVGLWEGLYNNIPLYVTNEDVIRDLDLIIRSFRVIPQGIAKAEV